MHNTQIQAAYQRTVPVSLLKARTVQAYRTYKQKLRHTIPYLLYRTVLPSLFLNTVFLYNICFQIGF